MLDQQDIHNIIGEAKVEAYAAADKYFHEKLGGVDRYACGFAWVNIHSYNDKPIKGNTKIGKMLKNAGVSQDYTRTFQIWNPSSYGVQNVDTLEAGAKAAAEVFRSHGFVAYAGSRLD